MLFAKPDLVLLHPPSVYDFRRLTIVPSPISDLVPSTPVFELYPIGFTYLGEYLERGGINTRVVNLAQRMLEDDRFDVPGFLSRLDPASFGIDLHWLTHAQGALEVARMIKEIHPSKPVIMGGYSATFFHRELVSYPFVDYVVRGDSTEEPLRRLMESILHGGSPLEIPNLTCKGPGGTVIENPLSYLPASLEYLGDNYRYMMRSAFKYGDYKSLRAFWNWWRYPVTMVLTCRGCARDCAFCGGSSSALSRLCGREKPAFRSPERIAYDVELISRFTAAPIFVVGDLLQGGPDYAHRTLELISHINFRNHLVLELFSPAPRDYFERVASSFDNYDFQISPETHDEGIREVIGKPYTNEELERCISWALDSGCDKFDIFFMIGLPGQDRDSVMQTVEYCGELLRRFGPRVNPSIGPLAPFIDPECIYHREPDRYGYRIIHHTLEEFAHASLSPHWRDMLGYETRWMSRQEIVNVTYEALLALNAIKENNGLISPSFAARNDRRIRDTLSLLKLVDDVMAIEDASRRRAELEKLRREARKLFEELRMPKEELTWPVVGSRFRRFNILRILMGWI